MKNIKKLPFEKYKKHLLDYLRLHGIEVEVGQQCACPWHEDSTPSFSVFIGDDGNPAFNCFGCGRAGDIYNAVEFCTGETNKRKQFDEIDRIFGRGEYSARGATLPAPALSEKPSFAPDPEALARLTSWLEKNDKAGDCIRGYFEQRALAKSGGTIYQYPREILDALVTFFFWWPGKQAAEAALGKRTLFAAGIPYKREDEKLPEENRRIAWYHSGVLAKSPEGFKLLFMDGTASRKMNPRAGVSYFPIPCELPNGRNVVLMEGEIDAILCRACGIENAFSMGGKGGLTKDRIKKFIVPKNIPEIILFADNDKDGGSQKKFGLLPIEQGDHIRETVPENLRKMGYVGKIRVTVLPDDCPFKDPDDAIRAGRLDLVKKAIADAREYVPPEKSDGKKSRAGGMKIDPRELTEWENVPVKFLRSFLKKLPYDSLSETQKERAVIAAAKACKEGFADIASWTNGAVEMEDVEKAAKKDGSPFDLIQIGLQAGLSNYLLDRFEEILVPAAEILNVIDPVPTVLPIDYDALAESKAFSRFLRYPDHAFASYALAAALKGNLLYIDTEEANYVYTGDYWTRIPSIATEAHAALTNTMLVYLRKNPKEKKAVLDCLQKIGSNSFRQKLANDLNMKEAQFYHDEKKQPVLFDSFPVRETLTLKDGVLDFSGDEIRFRRGKPEEFRNVPLPYTCRQIREATSPDFFMRAIDLDFAEPNEETLKKNPTRTKDTLLYYLSLVISRNVTKNYSCFMTGPGGTGKSTLVSALEEILGNENVAQLNSRVLVAKKKGFDNENGPTPEIAELEGKLLAITMELPEDGRLNSDQLKRLTGSDLISARQLRQGLHKFRPTAQIVIVGNELPSFYKHDSGIIRRLLVFHFNIAHNKRAKNGETKKLYKGIPSDSAKMIEKLRGEAPGIIRLLAEKYIELKREYNLNIPTSQECENAKSQYIEAQNRDTDEFYEQCVRFTPADDNAFIFSKDLYHCYLNFKGFQEGSPEALKQRNFILYLKKDHPELGGKNYCQKRPSAGALPEWGFKFISFTDSGAEYLQKQPDDGLPFDTTKKPEPPTIPPPEDNPFTDAPPLTDDDGNEIDIY